MPDTPTVRRNDVPEPVILAPTGDLDLASGKALVESVQHAATRDATGPIVIDLVGVEFMDSSGLRALLDSKTICDRAERGLVLVRVGSAVGHMLDVVALRDRFNIVETVDIVGQAGGD